MFTRLRHDRQGNVGIFAALTMTVIVGSAGYAIDYAGWVKQRMAMQSVADIAALASANAYATDKQISTAQAATARFVTYNPVYGNQPGASTTLVNGNSAIRVSLTAAGDTNFTSILGLAAPTIQVDAVASLPAPGVPCVLALDPGNVNGAIHLDSNARITTPNCTVRSVSTGQQAIQVNSNASIAAEQVCTSGGYKTLSNGTITPEPQNCPQIPDPFASIAEPAVGGCSFNNYKADGSGAVILTPGVYCGGLELNSNVIATFLPGAYIIKNGKLYFDSNIQATGVGVTFFLTGTNATIDFNSNVTVNFTAPSMGPMKGILFFEDRDQPLLNVHNFDSNAMNVMEGLIYLSRGVFHCDSNVAVFGTSNYTLIMARRVDLNSNANLVLNADFGNSAVPLPDGESSMIATRLIE